MGLFNFRNINTSYEQFLKHDHAVLVDVRMESEFSQGHLPKALNIPVHKLEAITSKVKNMETPLYVYCLSGGRSRQAVRFLKQMGYKNLVDMGGIQNYRGKVVM